MKSYRSTTPGVNFPSKRIVNKQLLLYTAQNCNWANLQNPRAGVKEPLMSVRLNKGMNTGIFTRSLLTANMVDYTSGANEIQKGI